MSARRPAAGDGLAPVTREATGVAAAGPGAGVAVPGSGQAGPANGAGLPARLPPEPSLPARGRKPRGKAANAQAAGPVGLRQSAALSQRLMALARMIQIGTARSGRDGFSKKLLAEAEDVLARAGERMRLSSAHTVVALAGGTGSGKSSLFNRLAGAEFSTVGVTRPVTRDVHACIWGEAGAGSLIDWLKVPARNRYSRASALDEGDDDLLGLVLLDLPDHDSVMSHAGGQVDRMVRLADMVIWVLDPQKYADAAVHRRFLIPLAGHSDVLAIVLNQCDQLDAQQIDECRHDLRRLLDSENVHDVPILATSAVTGNGLAELRQLLIERVAARRAAAARISDDLDRLARRFAAYASGNRAVPSSVPAQARQDLAEQFAAAAGLQAVGDSLLSARELRAADFVGWPFAWLAQRMTGRNPLRKMRLGSLWAELRATTAGPSGAQQADVDNALTRLGDKLAEKLPRPWSRTVRGAVRSRAVQIPAALGAAISAELPAEDSIPWWWRLVGLWQGVLAGAVAVALAWTVAIMVLGVFHAASSPPLLFSNAGLLPWLMLAILIMLALGAATASVCLSSVRKAAEQERAAVLALMHSRIEDVAAEMVVVPAELELSELSRYREESRLALGGR